MRVIILTQGQHTVVGDDVFEWASKFKWHAKRKDCAFYAARAIRLPDGRRAISYLHREIMKAGEGVEVDHRDNDGLNNLGDNLRTCSSAENKRNCPMRRNNTSGFKGVSFHKVTGKWQASIKIIGRLTHLGLFDQAIDAACAYDRAATELHSAFAQLNFPQTTNTVL